MVEKSYCNKLEEADLLEYICNFLLKITLGMKISRPVPLHAGTNFLVFVFGLQIKIESVL